MALQLRNGTGPPYGAENNWVNGSCDNGGGGRIPRPFLTCYDTDSGVVLIVAKRASFAASAEGPSVGMLSFSETYGGDVSTGTHDPGMESDSNNSVDELLPFNGALGNLKSAIQQPLELATSHKASHKTQFVAGMAPPNQQNDIDLHLVDGQVLEKAVEVTTKRKDEVTFVDMLPGSRGYHYKKKTKTTTVETKEDSRVDIISALTPSVKMASPVVKPPHSSPVFTKFLNSCRVCEGQPAKFDVTVTGTPKLEIWWYNNGQQLSNSPETKIISQLDGSSSLIIPKTLPKHSGTLTCKAENIAGLASCTAKLLVEGPRAPAPQSYSDTEQIQSTQTTTTTRAQDYTADGETNLDQCPGQACPPTITSLITTQDALVGGITRFECAFTGQPRPSVKWFKNGKEVIPDGIRIIMKIEQFGGSFLEIRNVKPDDDAQYMVKVTNPAGEASSVARLTVNIDGVIDSDASESQHQMRVCVGMDKNPDPEVHLISTDKQNGPVIHTAARHQTPISISAACHTSDVKMHESKTCTHKSTTTTVTGTTKDETEGSEEGDDCSRLRRPVGGGSDAVVLHRYPLVAMPPINININIGTSSPEVAPEAPRFSQRLADAVVTEGGSITITSTISGHPFPGITWYKGNTLIKDSQDFQYLINSNRVSLKIKAALLQDTGEYTCRADNVYGTTMCICHITVYPKTMTSLDDVEEMARSAKKTTTTITTLTNDIKVSSEVLLASTESVVRTQPPKFLNELLDMEVQEGSVARFDARVFDHPIPTITWFIDGTEVKPGGRYTIQFDDLGHCSLTIYRITHTDAGEVECRAINPYGVVSSFANLVVSPIHGINRRPHRHYEEDIIRRPKFVEPMEPQQVLAGETVTIACRVSALPTPNIAWYKDGRALFQDKHHVTTYREDGTCMLSIIDVVAEDKAEYMCKAVNELGKAVSYAKLAVHNSLDMPNFQREVNLLSTSRPEDSWTESEYHVDRHMSDKEIIETITTKKTITRKVSVEKRGSASELTPPLQPVKQVRKELLTPLPKPEFPKKPIPVPYEPKEEKVIPVTKPEEEVEEFKEPPPLEDAPFQPVILQGEFETLVLSEPEVVEEPSVDEAQRTVTETVTVEKKEKLEDVAENKAPEFTRHLNDVEVYKDETVTLECQIIGYPRPTVEWYSNGALIDVGESERYTSTYDQTGVSIFTISPVTEEDNTGFECRATNEMGTVSTFCAVYLLRRSPSPAHIGQFNVNFNQTDSNVTEVPGTVTETVTVERVEEVVEYKAPEVIRHLTDVEVYKGETVNLECQIIGYPRPTIEWYSNDVLIDAGKSERYTSTYDQTGVSVLTISPVTEEGNTGFECRATNEMGTVSTFCTICLHRRSPSSEDSDQTKIQIQEEEEQLCEVEIIVQQQEVEHVEKEVVQVEQIVRETVPVQREEVEAFEYLTPEVTRRLEDIEVEIGQRVELECEIQAYPTPTIEWYRDEVLLNINASKRYTSTYDETGVYILAISEVTEGDNRRFECRASNEVGTASTFANICLLTAASSELRKRAGVEMKTKPKLPGSEFVIHSEEESKITVEEVRETKEAHIQREEAPKPNTLHPDVGKRPEEAEVVTTLTKVAETTTQAEESKFGMHAEIPPSVVTSEEESETIRRIQVTEVVEIPKMEVPQFEEPMVIEGHLEEAPQRISPEIVRHLRHFEVFVGQEVQLVCKVDGYPSAVVEWFKDGKPVEGERFTKTYVENDANLHIKPITNEDDTGFECRVTSEFRTVSTFVEISLLKWSPTQGCIEHTEGSVEKMPEPLPKVQFIVQQPAEQTVTARENVTTVSERVTVKKEEEPQYMAPQVIRHLRDVDVTINEVVRLECQIIGYPCPTIEWYRDDVLIEETECYTTSFEETGVCVLVIHEFIEMENATFECRASNGIDTISSFAKVHLTKGSEVEEVTEKVTEVPRRVTEIMTVEGKEEVEEQKMEENKAPEIIRHLTDVELYKDETVTLESQIIGYPRPIVEWYSNGALIDVGESERYTSTYDQTGVSIFTISPVTEEDNTGFECRATNEMGTVSTFCAVYLLRRSPSPAHIGQFNVNLDQTDSNVTEVPGTVTETVTVERKERVEEVVEYKAPEVIRHLTDVEVYKDETVNLECQIIGYPRPTIEWYSNDVLIDAGKSERYTSTYDQTGVSVLTISPVTEEGNTEFECRATNEMGTVSTFCTIYLHRRSSSSEDIDQTKIQIQEEAEQLREVEIIVQQQEVEHVEKEVVQVEQIVHETVAVQREEVEAFEYLAPEVTRRLEDIEVEIGQRVELECEIQAYPTPTIEWYRDEVLLNINASKRFTSTYDETGVYILAISEVTEGDNRRFECRASNEVGTASTFANICLLTAASSELRKKAGVEMKTKPKLPGSEFVIHSEEESKITVEEVRETKEAHIQREESPKPNTLHPDVGKRPEEAEVVTTLTKVAETTTRAEESKFGMHAEIPPSVVTSEEESETIRRRQVTEVVEIPKMEVPQFEQPMVIEGHLEEAPQRISPEIVRHLRHFEVFVGQEVQLVCKVDGYPSAVVEWFKDGKPVEGERFTKTYVENDANLHIKPITNEDDTGFECRVTSEFRTVSTFVEISLLKWSPTQGCIEHTEGSVEKMPEPLPKVQFIVQQPAEQTVTARENVTTVYERVTVKKEEEPQYIAPQVIRHLRDVDVTINEVVRLECQIIGYPCPTIEWYRDDVLIEETECYTTSFEETGVCVLVIHEFIEMENATFECRASNGIDTISSFAKVHLTKGSEVEEVTEKVTEVPRRVTEIMTVEGKEEVEEQKVENKAPEIIRHLTDVEVYKDETVTLECQIIGYPSPTVEWYSNGALIDFGESERYTSTYDQTGVSIFTISPVTEEDNTGFECRATNEMGTVSTFCAVYLLRRSPSPAHIGQFNVNLDQTDSNVTKVPGTVTETVTVERKERVEEVVEYKAPEVIRYLTDVEVYKDETVNLECQIIGYPRPTMEWYSNDVLIDAGKSERYTSTYDQTGVSVLTISPVTEEGNTGFECRATNEMGTVSTFCTIYLHTRSPSSEDIDQTKIQIQEEAEQLHEVEIIVQQQEVEHVEKEVVQVEQIVHETVAVEREEVEAFEYLAPEVTRRLEDIEVEIGQRVELECEIQAYPTPTIEWYRDEVLLNINASKRYTSTYDETGVYILAISEVTEGDNRRFECRASNEVGTASTFANICLLTAASSELRKKAGVEMKTKPKLPGSECVIHSEEESKITVEKVRETKEAHIQREEAPKPITLHPDVGKRPEKAEVVTTLTKVAVTTTRAEESKLGMHAEIPPSVVTSQEESETIRRRQVTEVVEIPKMEVPQFEQPMVIEGHLEEAPQRISPEIVRHLRHFEVFVGQEVQLVCKVDGYPSAVVEWFKDGKPVEGERFTKTYVENDANLHIKPITDEDDTGFECRVTSEFRTVSTFVEISLLKWSPTQGCIEHTEGSVEKMPEPLPKVQFIVQQPAEQTVTARENVTTVSERVTVKKEEEPQYIAPQVIRHLRDVDVTINEVVRLECQIIGYPCPTIEWYRDDVLIEETECYTTSFEETGVCVLVIHEFIEMENATFECRASNGIDTISSFAKVHLTKGSEVEEVTEKVTEVPRRVTEIMTVEGKEEVEEQKVEENKAPEIIRHLTDVEVYKDETVTLECQIIGYPRPTVEWYSNGALIDFGESERYTSTYNQTGVSIFTISPVTEEDNTGFECRATNEMGTVSTFCAVYLLRRSPSPAHIGQFNVNLDQTDSDVTEVPGTVTETVTVERKERVEEVVEYKAPEVIRHLTDVEVYKDETVNLECQIIGYPRPTMEWYSNDVLIDAGKSERYTSTYDQTGVSVLTISPVTEEGNTGFECRATNEMGTVSTFCTIYLHTRSPSSEDIDQTKIQIQEEAEQLREVEIIVQQQEVEHVEKEVVQVEQIVHETVAVQREEVEAFEYLAPEVTRRLEDIEVEIGQRVELECEIQAYPTPTIEWYRDEVLLNINASKRYTSTYDETGVYILAISEVTEGDNRRFECRASNEVGTASTFANICLLTAASSELRKKAGVEMKTKPKLPGSEFVIHSEEESKITVEEVRETKEAHIQSEEAPKPNTLHPDVGKRPEEAEVVTTLTKVAETTTRAEESKFGMHAEIPPSVVTSEEESETIRRRQVTEVVEIPKMEVPQFEQPVVIEGHLEEAPQRISPEIVRHLRHFEVFVGQEVQLVCKVDGYPSAVVEWFKDGKPVEGERFTKTYVENDANLHIKPITDEDDTGFECRVTSEFRTVSTFVEISLLKWSPTQGCIEHTEGSVEKMPEPLPKVQFIVQQPAEQTVTATENVTTVSERVTVKKEEEPQYIAPQVIRHLRDVDVTINEVVRLECQIIGYPCPTIEWYRDDVLIEETECYTTSFEETGVCVLVIHEFIEMENATFECRASNGIDTISSFAKVHLTKGSEVEEVTEKVTEVPRRVTEIMTVEGKEQVEEQKVENKAPEIIRHLTDVEVYKDETVTLECQIIGYPRPTVEWYSNGALIDFGESERYTSTYDQTGVSIFTISPVTEEDNTGFECIATNEMGTVSTFCAVYLLRRSPSPAYIGQFNVNLDQTDSNVTEVPGTVTETVTVERKERVEEVVEYKAPEVIRHLTDVEVYKDETVNLECQIIGYPRPTMEWYSNDVLIDAGKSERYTSTYDQTGVSVLTISPVTEEGNTGFECRATNEMGTVSTFCTIYLHTRSPSSEDIDQTKIQIQEEAEQLREVEIIVQQQEVEHVEKEVVQVEQIVHETVAVQREEVEAFEYLAPEVTRRLEDIEVEIGQRVELECEIQAYPTPTIEWYRDEVLLNINASKRYTSTYDETGVYILAISEVTEGDNRRFECRASNEVGTASTFANICLLTAASSELRKKAGVEMKTKPKLPGSEFVIHSEEESKITVEEVRETKEAHIQSEEAPKPNTLHPDVGKRPEEAEVVTTLTKVAETTTRAEESKFGMHAEIPPSVVTSEEESETIRRRQVTEVVEIPKMEVPQFEQPIVIEGHLEEAPQRISPEIVRHLRHFEVFVGQEVQLVCKVDGYPSAVVEWFKDGKPVEGERFTKTYVENDANLHIKPITDEDDTGFECRVTSEFRTVSTFVEISLLKWSPTQGCIEHTEGSVEKMPEPQPKVQFIVQQPAEQTVTARENVTTVSERVTVKKEEEPQYIAPQVIRHLRDVDVTINEVVRLECQIIGYPCPTIEWYRDDVLIEETECYTTSFEETGVCVLVIHEFIEMENATFECRASNGIDTISSFAKVHLTKGSEVEEATEKVTEVPRRVTEIMTVEGKEEVEEQKVEENKAPEIIRHLTDVEVYKDETVTLECQIIGYPRPTVEWYSNGALIDVGESERYTSTYDQTGVSIFTISPVTEEDKTGFECRATNEMGTVSTFCAVYLLRRSPSPAHIGQINVNFNQTYSNVTEVSKTATEAVTTERKEEEVQEYRAAEVEVYKKDVAIVGKPEDVQVELTDTEDGSTGVTITCETMPEEETEIFEPKLDKGPKFVKTLMDTKAQYGQRAELFCQVEPYTKPAVQWFRDGVEIVTSEGYEITCDDENGASSLIIMQEKDDTKFECRATNEFGIVSTYAEVIVKDEARPMSELHVKGDDRKPEEIQKIEQVHEELIMCTQLPTTETHLTVFDKEEPLSDDAFQVNPKEKPPAGDEKDHDTEEDRLAPYDEPRLQEEYVTPSGLSDGDVLYSVDNKETTENESDQSDKQMVTEEPFVCKITLQDENLPYMFDKVTVTEEPKPDGESFASLDSGGDGIEKPTSNKFEDFVPVSAENTEPVEVAKVIDKTQLSQESEEPPLTRKPSDVFVPTQEADPLKKAKLLGKDPDRDNIHERADADQIPVSEPEEVNMESTEDEDSKSDKEFVLFPVEEIEIVKFAQLVDLTKGRDQNFAPQQEFPFCNGTGKSVESLPPANDRRLFQTSERQETASSDDEPSKGHEVYLLSDDELDSFTDHDKLSSSISGADAKELDKLSDEEQPKEEPTLASVAARAQPPSEEEPQHPLFISLRCPSKDEQTGNPTYLTLDVKVDAPQPSVIEIFFDGSPKRVTYHAPDGSSQPLLVNQPVINVDIAGAAASRSQQNASESNHNDSSDSNYDSEVDYEPPSGNNTGVPPFLSEPVSSPPPPGKPVFTKKLQDTTAVEGDNAVMQCYVHGAPSPDVTWFKDGQEIHDSDHIQIKTSNFGNNCIDIVINDVSKSDSGEYTVKACNSEGSASCSAVLKVETLKGDIFPALIQPDGSGSRSDPRRGFDHGDRPGGGIHSNKDTRDEKTTNTCGSYGAQRGKDDHLTDDTLDTYPSNNGFVYLNTLFPLNVNDCFPLQNGTKTQKLPQMNAKTGDSEGISLQLYVTSVNNIVRIGWMKNGKKFQQHEAVGKLCVEYEFGELTLFNFGDFQAGAYRILLVNRSPGFAATEKPGSQFTPKGNDEPYIPVELGLKGCTRYPSSESYNTNGKKSNVGKVCS